MSARDAPKLQIDRQTTTPFHLKLFYRLNAFHHLSDFPVPSPSSFSQAPPGPVPASGPNSIRRTSRSSPPHHHPSSSSSTPAQPLPPHLQIYTWQSCTLRELSHLLTSALPSLLPDPPVGSRLCFRLIYPDTKGAAMLGPDARGRYLSKDLGSVIVGAREGVLGSGSGSGSGSGARRESVDGGTTTTQGDANANNGSKPGPLRLQGDDAEKTLHDFRFVVGDYVDCAILPPLEDGSVAPAIVSGRGPSLAIGGGMRAFRENGFGGGRLGRGGGRGGGGGGGMGDRERGLQRVLSGDWRRGERLPDGAGRAGSRRGWAPY